MYNFKKLNDVLSQLTCSRSKHEVFSELLNFFLIPFEYHNTGEALKKQYEDLMNNKNRALFLEFFTELSILSDEGFCDPLGDFYMESISHGHLGQYFTPEPLCDMMAIMILSDIENDKTVLDPACGSGRFLLSAAKMNRTLKLYGADLDQNCCKMALINMLMNSLSGEIAHMNSISNEFYKSYIIQTRLINGHHYPYFYTNTDPENSRITLKIVQEAKGQPVFVQGDLFS